MTRKSAAESNGSHGDHWSTQWVCSLSVVMFVVAFGLSGQVLPRFMTSQCTSEQGMCTPGGCTCPFPLMKRDLVTQDAQACSQCVEEFCPAVPEGDTACSSTACECEDPSWPRIDIGTEQKPCLQCVHPHVDMTLRGDHGDCLELSDSLQPRGPNGTCTVFRFNGAAMLAKPSNSCLTWADESWQVVQCRGTPDSSAKFTQRSRGEEDSKNVYCTGRGKQCLHSVEYMCTTDPSQCSTEQCRCEDPTHVRKALQTINRSTCYLCAPPLPTCSSSPACSPGPCECKPGFFKARQADDCFSCQPGSAPSLTGFSSLLSFISAAATFLCCVALGVAVGCAIRRFIVGDAAPNLRRRRRGAQPPRTWSERWALHLEDAAQAAYDHVSCWKPLRRVSSAVCKGLDACDEALEPVYVVLEAALDKAQNALGAISPKFNEILGKADEAKRPLRAKRDPRKENRGPRGARPSQEAAQAEKESGDLAWDPISMSMSSEAPSVTVPKEWMNFIVPGLSARQSARPRSDSPPPTSAVQRLRQRREAKAQAAAEKAAAQAAAPMTEAPVDESWIDAMEREEAKEREAKERAAAQRRERKQAAKARRAKGSAEGSAQETERSGAEEGVSTHTGKQVLFGQESASGEKQQSDRLFSEAIHGMFLLATSDAGHAEKASSVREVAKKQTAEAEAEEAEAEEEDEAEEEAEVEEEVAAEIRPCKEDIIDVKSVDLKAGNEDLLDDDVAEDNDDGWTRSTPSKSRGSGKRRGQEKASPDRRESGHILSEQEPAAEPDPQQDPEPSETQECEVEPQQVEPSLSKRQKQRLRQRQGQDKKSEAPARKASKEAESAKQPKAGPTPTASTSDARKEPKAPKASNAKADADVKADVTASQVQEDSEEPKALVRNFADVVAGRPARPPREEEDDFEEEMLGFSSFTADAPDFVPMAYQAMTASAYSYAMGSRRPRRRRGRKEAEDSQALPLTTVVITEIPDYDAQSLRLQLEGWGLPYNFFYMPAERQEEYGQCAVVNFVDPSCVMICQQLFQQLGEGSVNFFPVQGLENNVSYWTSMGVTEDTVSGPVVIPEAAQWFDPSMLSSKFSPQIREQFHKTKMCVFNKKQKCSMGAQCPFAHSEEELQKAPDLTKTKLCYNFFRRKCNDSKCKFAHGYGELRATDTVFKTELCRWWANGSCKAGDSCRYAHGIEELRTLAYPNPGMFGADFDLSQLSQADFGFDGYGYDLADFQMPDMPDVTNASADASADADDGGAGIATPTSEDNIHEMLQERSATGSDAEISEALDFGMPGVPAPGVGVLTRQRTAPPSVAVSKDDDVILRIKGTFMEAVRIDEELQHVSMHRSWSDGDLAQLLEAMDSDSD
ncbi:unnamed protein product [Effrenium voratum]|nr:unnamed protein product [Effrenium voratum]